MPITLGRSFRVRRWWWLTREEVEPTTLPFGWMRYHRFRYVEAWSELRSGIGPAWFFPLWWLYWHRWDAYYWLRRWTDRPRKAKHGTDEIVGAGDAH